MMRFGDAPIACLLVATLVSACGRSDPGPLIEPFRSELSRLAHDAEADQRIAINGLDGWLFFGPELRHLSLNKVWGSDAVEVTRARRPEDADPLPAILDFKQQLDTLGVELLLVPVPPKAAIFPEKISDAIEIPIPVPRLDPALQQFYEQLQASGVDLLDLTEHFITERFHAEGPLYCRTDTHWSGTGCTVAAAAIAARVRARPWYEALEHQTFGASWYSTTITGDLTLNGGVRADREELRLRGVVTAIAGTRARSSVPPDPNSAVVLLGDSHNLVFHVGDDMHASGAGLPDQLAFELGLPIDVVAVRGSGATPARINLLRRAQTDPTYWNKKRLVIWCFAARELTESDGWRLVPIVP